MSIKKTFSQVGAAALFCLTLQACGPSKPGIYKTDDLGYLQKRTLHGLDNALLASLKNGALDEQEQLMSQEYIANQVARVKVTSEATVRMKWGEYSLHSEYLVINSADTGSNVIKERAMGINNFDLKVPIRTPQMYIAQFTAKNAAQSWLITATFSKLDYGWKIDDIELSPYTENGKTAPEQTEYAKELLAKGAYLDANNAMSYAMNCLQPSDYFTYVNQKDIEHFFNTAHETVAAKQHLRIPLKNIATEPLLWRVTVERNKEGAFPNINYISKINLLDTMALKKENLEVQKSLPGVIPGVDKEKKYIYFTIYNQTKQGVPVQTHYDLRQKL